jgi:uncharacterized coiled-coil protein SlyX
MTIWHDIQNFSGYHSVEKPPKKLLEQVSDVIRLKHYSYKTECLQLRVKDLDFAQKQLTVRDAKGMESRVTMLPTRMNHQQTTIDRLGIVVIGRNEGERLHKCLLSVLGKVASIVYVDSGSIDSSVQMAQSL